MSRQAKPTRRASATNGGSSASPDPISPSVPDTDATATVSEDYVRSRLRDMMITSARDALSKGHLLDARALVQAINALCPSRESMEMERLTATLNRA